MVDYMVILVTTLRRYKNAGSTVM